MPHGQGSMKERVTAAWRRFYDWKTEHQFLGRYSVDKLQQFDRYQTHTSLARCLIVICLLSVLPVFVLIVGLHAIPVASPNLGVRHNVAASVQSAMAYAVLTVTWVFYMMQSLASVKECRPLRTFVVSIIIGGLVPEGLWVVVSLFWRYPAPGGGVAKMVITLGCIFYLTRCCQTKEARVLNRQRIRILTIVMAEHLVIVVFFLMLALAFSQAPWGIQLALMIVQPPLRAFLKRQSWVYARKLNDLSTDVTLNIVDISASMYQALCIQYAQNVELAALIVAGECLLGAAVARMYSTHTFIVDGCRTLQTAIKIAEGSLSSTLVNEEDETQKEEIVIQDEEIISQAALVEEVITRDVQAIQIPASTQKLRRASSDTLANNAHRSMRQLGAASGSAPSSNDSRRASKCFPTVIQKVRRVVSDPVTGKTKRQHQEPPRRHSTESNALPYGGGSHHAPTSVKKLRRAASYGMPVETTQAKPQRLHRRMTTLAGSSAEPREPPLSPNSIHLLRRTASDTIPESKFERERPTRKSAFVDANRDQVSRKSEPRLQSWSRDPAKVHCFFNDIRPEVAPPPPSPKQKKARSQGRRNSLDLPPLGDLQPLDGFGRHPQLRRSASLFLTPRTLMKHGSKRLLDLGRSSGRNPGNPYAAGEELTQKSNSPDARKPTQVNIDGMLVVRKDQARILEQTLQLLFSCEVLVVTEFIKVVVPLILGRWQQTAL
ncbi:unnamed protein product [Phytophthora lilii]|uniref:Unnamed protein product n=1 Tax=Phytophthora lilii TaxID=2077276 RepID=A0A9W6TIA4_9STRA|nr:unnamed protein product [Phytophthora lilii]